MDETSLFDLAGRPVAGRLRQRACRWQHRQCRVGSGIGFCHRRTPAPAAGRRRKQYYTETTVDDTETMLQYHIIDLDSGEDTIPCDVKGCPHNTADCPAVTTKLPSTPPLVVDENTLLALSGPYEAATLFLMDRNCQNRRNLVELDGIYPYWNTRILYTDGEALYFFGAENDGTHLYRVALADGAVTDLSGGHPLESPTWVPSGGSLC